MCSFTEIKSLYLCYLASNLIANVFCPGVVYSWGRDEGEGRLGHAEADRLGENEVPYPMAVPGLPPVHTLACGGFFTVALTKEGGVWSWGGKGASVRLSTELHLGASSATGWRIQGT